MSGYIKKGTFQYGDNPTSALGKFNNMGQVIDEVLYTPEHVELHYASANGGISYWFRIQKFANVNLYELDNKVYLTKADLNADLIGRVVHLDGKSGTIRSISISHTDFTFRTMGGDILWGGIDRIGMAWVEA